jgi:hypothetical protein
MEWSLSISTPAQTAGLDFGERHTVSGGLMRARIDARVPTASQGLIFDY